MEYKGYIKKVWNTLNQFHLDENINRFVVFVRSTIEQEDGGKEARKSLNFLFALPFANRSSFRCVYGSMSRKALSWTKQTFKHLLRNDLLNQMIEENTIHSSINWMLLMSPSSKGSGTKGHRCFVLFYVSIHLFYYTTHTFIVRHRAKKYRVIEQNKWLLC